MYYKTPTYGFGAVERVVREMAGGLGGSLLEGGGSVDEGGGGWGVEFRGHWAAGRRSQLACPVSQTVVSPA